MAFKLTNVDLLALNGKSGKFVVNENHVVFEGRDGTITVLATSVKARATKRLIPVSVANVVEVSRETAISVLDVDALG